MTFEYRQYRGLWRAYVTEHKYGETVKRVCRDRGGSIISNDTREGLERAIRQDGEKG